MRQERDEHMRKRMNGASSESILVPCRFEEKGDV